MTVVSRRRRRRVDDVVEQRERVGRRGEVVLALTDEGARSASLDTICAGSNHCFAHVDLPDATGPTSTTTHGDGNASGSSLGAPVIDRPRYARPGPTVLAVRGHGSWIC